MKQNLLEVWSFFRENRGAMFGLFLIVIFVLIGALAPVIAPYDPSFIHEGNLRLPPFWSAGSKAGFLFGTDDVGRDLLSRLIYGARVSMGIGFFVVLFSVSLGTLLGVVSGYFGGWVDLIIMRFSDVLLTLPSLLLAVVVVAIMGAGLTTTVLAVGVVTLPRFIRIIRALVMQEKLKTYVTASETFGASHLRQMFSNILPNCMAPLLVQATLTFSDGILDASALGFLGLGAQPPTPEWGTMLADARAFIESSPWMVTLPGICIFIAVLAFNVLGDGLRDAFDPKLRKA